MSGVDSDHTKSALVARLTSFADEVGMEVVAEGIETEAELDALRALGVGTGQGFLLGRPGPMPDTIDGSLRWPRAYHGRPTASRPPVELQSAPRREAARRTGTGRAPGTRPT